MRKFIVGSVAVLALAGMAMAAEISYTGWVNDAKCAAGGAKPNAACVKKCADAGEKLVFVDDKEQKVMQVANQDALKAHPGEHVKIKASTTSDGALQISDVKTIAQAKDTGAMHDHK